MMKVMQTKADYSQPHKENKYISDISTLITNEIRNALENLSRKGVGFINLETTDAIQYQIDNRIFDITVKEQDR